MKFGLGTAYIIFFVAVTSAQENLQSILAEVPACAQSCVLSAAESSPCASDQTVACVCANIQAIIPAVSSCAVQAGCSQADLNTLSSLESSINCPSMPSSVTSSIITPSTTSPSTAATSTAYSLITSNSMASSLTSPTSNPYIIGGTTATSSFTYTTISSNATSTKAPETFQGAAANVVFGYEGVAVLVILAWIL